MHTDTFEKCAYFFRTPPENHLDYQLLNSAGDTVRYYNVFLSDAYLTNYLWNYYSSHQSCEKNSSYANEDEQYVIHIFDYAIRSYGKELDYRNYCGKSCRLNPVEHRLATMLIYCIQNPSKRLTELLLTQTFEYFRSLILIKMGFFTQLLLSCCLIYSRTIK